MICDGNLSLFNLNDNTTVLFLNALINISNIYGVVHKYLCLFICVFGMFFNVLHIFVLTRPNMQKCAVNRLLSIIAVCDILTMLSYLIFVVRFGLMVDLSDPPLGYSFFWVSFLLAHVMMSIGLHTTTLYLSCVTAYIRYKTLKTVGSKWNRQSSAGPIFLMIASAVGFLCIPTFLLHKIINVRIAGRSIETYTVALDSFSSLSTCFLFKFNLWLTGIFFKVIPCMLLFLFTVALLYELELSKQRRMLMTSGSSNASRRSRQADTRTTKVLVVLLTIFLVTEFPQGILAILNGFYPNDIHQFVYMSLGELLDLLSLINCNTCFIVYPIVSSQYRLTLRILLENLRGRLFGIPPKNGTWPKKDGRRTRHLENGQSFTTAYSPSCSNAGIEMISQITTSNGSFSGAIQKRQLRYPSKSSHLLHSDYALMSRSPVSSSSSPSSPTTHSWAISPSPVFIPDDEPHFVIIHQELDVLL